MRLLPLSALLLLVACNSQDKVVDKTKVSDKKTAISDDFGGSRPEAAPAPAQANAPGMGSPAAPPVAAQAPAPQNIKGVVLSPGTAPKLRRYVMTPGTVETRDIALQMSEEASEAPGKVRGQAFVMKVEFKVLSANAAGNTLSATIKSIAAQGKGPEVAQMNAQLSAAAGISFQFDVSPVGGLDNLKPLMSADQSNPAALQAAMGVLQLASEAFDALFPPMPDAPVGDGGSWEVTMPSENGAPTKSLLTAQSWDKGTLTVSANAVMPKSKAKLQGGGEAMVEGRAKTAYRYVNKLNGVPSMVQGERTDDQIITLGPGQVVKVKRSSKVAISASK